MNALQLCSLFAFSPNKMGYCGLDSAQKEIYNCVVNGKCDQIREEFTHFKGLYAYLQTIGEVLNKDWLDYDVVEAYWLGNDQLKMFKLKHYEILLKYLREQGLPDFFIDEYSKKRPKVFIPLHLFNVIHFGVGQITGSVEFNLDNVNHCMIRRGRVISIEQINKKTNEQNKVLIELNYLEEKNGDTSYNLKTTSYMCNYIPEFFPDLQVGDEVAVHWKQVVKVLKENEVNNLEVWTNKLLANL